MNPTYKKLSTAFCLSITVLHAQEWTFMKGTSLTNQYGVYGTQGLAAAGNLPGGRVAAAMAKDNSGNFWLFGGGGYGSSSTSAVGLSDLWKYNIASNQWTWMAGTGTPDLNGIYGTLGTPSSANNPGGRQLTMSWSDNSGNFWMYGGYGASATAGGVLSDLWKFDVGLGQWVWINGPNTANQAAVYGTQGVAAAANTPGARHSAITWKDSNGDLWLFGGASNLGSLVYNDLWKYNIASNQWTWMSGSNTSGASGVYGTIGTAASGNVPGARVLACSWADANGNLWLFGGGGNASSGSGTLNDLWKYNITSNQWAWMSGSNLINAQGVYGTMGVPSSATIPGARSEAICCSAANGDLLLFGGTGYATTSSPSKLNDVWRYSVSTNLWTWMKGANTVNQLGSYGTMGVQAPSNTPGARTNLLGWGDSGNFWIFSGQGYNGSIVGYLNDLWKFNPCTVVPPNPVNTTNPANLNICAGNTTTLSATSSTYTINWFATATSTSVLYTGNSVNVSAFPVGQYTFYVEGSGCQPSAQRTAIQFTVNTVPVIAVNSGSVCAGSVFTLHPGGASTYTVSGGSNTVSPAVFTTYSVTGTSANGCISAAAAIASVNVLALPDFTVNPTVLICAGENAVLSITGTDTYQWSTGAGGNSITVNPLNTTTYTVTATAANGCSLKQTLVQQVNACTGVKEEALSDLPVVYPNPSKGEFSVNMPETAFLQIVDVTGKPIFEKKLDEGKQTVDLSGFSSGIYFGKIKMRHTEQRIKLVKE